MDDNRNKNATAVIFIDFSNAFNTVQIEKLEEIMEREKMPRKLTKWITNFLNNRKTIIEVDGQKIAYKVVEGLPQGDVLSPTLFNLYTMDFHKLVDKNIRIAQFADDFAAIAKGRTCHEAMIKLQAFLMKFNLMAIDLNLDINTEKTKAMIMADENEVFQLQINGQSIETVQKQNYLGVVIDNQLRFTAHANELAKRITERQNMLKVISTIKRGAHPQTMLNIHNALIGSMIEYGASIYGRGTKKALNKIETSSRQSLRIVSGCAISTPINSLRAIVAKEPLDIKREYIAKKEIAKHFQNEDIIMQQLRRLQNSPKLPKNSMTFIESIYVNNKHAFENICGTTSLKCPEITINDSMKNNILAKRNVNPSILRSLATEMTETLYKWNPKIYTDASKMDEKCGIGIYYKCDEIEYHAKLKNETSIMTAELTAIKTALDYINVNEIADAVIFTDSKTSCMYLKRNTESKEKCKLASEIIQIAHKNNTIIQWIPSHVNIEGNEIADEMAKSGLTSDYIISNKILAIDAIKIFQTEKNKKFNEWYKEMGHSKGKYYMQIQPQITEYPWFKNTNLNNVEIRLLNRLKSGHNYSKSHLNRIGIENNPNCEQCNIKEDAEHLIMKCPKFETTRNHYKINEHQNLISILKSQNIKHLKDLCDFIKEPKFSL